jgi:6-phosphogluconate dehydrogenase
MKLGVVGLGKMGGDVTRRLIGGGHQVVVHDQNAEAMGAVSGEGAVPAESLDELVDELSAPRVVWLMVPSGTPTEQIIKQLAEMLGKDDILVDGGNSNYQDTVRRARALGERGLCYIDVGISGGVWGLEEGYSMTVGGEVEAIGRLEPIFKTLAPAPDRGWGRVGPSGAGHFVKMVHNGIEYGMMQAYAEGFELMSHKTEFGLDLQQVAEIWSQGSVVRSWLLDLVARALAEDKALEGAAPYVEDSGEGRWTVVEAIELRCAIPVISAALEERFSSREAEKFSRRLLNALRSQFGGHELQRKVDPLQREGG